MVVRNRREMSRSGRWAPGSVSRSGTVAVMRQRRRADAVTLSASADLKLCALRREDKADVHAGAAR